MITVPSIRPVARLAAGAMVGPRRAARADVLPARMPATRTQLAPKMDRPADPRPRATYIVLNEPRLAPGREIWGVFRRCRRRTAETATGSGTGKAAGGRRKGTPFSLSIAFPLPFQCSRT